MLMVCWCDVFGWEVDLGMMDIWWILRLGCLCNG